MSCICGFEIQQRNCKQILENGAKIPMKNRWKKKDNVFHSLIRHAANNPDKMPQVVDMIHYFLAEEITKPITHVAPLWQHENEDRLTPLKLATKKVFLEYM